jgi:hypothetical protein
MNLKTTLVALMLGVSALVGACQAEPEAPDTVAPTEPGAESVAPQDPGLGESGAPQDPYAPPAPDEAAPPAAPQDPAGSPQ